MNGTRPIYWVTDSLFIVDGVKPTRTIKDM